MSNIKLFNLRNKKRDWLITLVSSSFASGASIALLVTSSWLIVSASLQPPILTLTVAVVSVRFFGISRGVFRYIERYTSHNLVFKEIQDLRISLWQKISSNVKNSYANLSASNAVNTLIRDLDGIQDIWLRAMIPWISGAILLVLIIFWIGLVNLTMCLVFLTSYFLAGVVFPLLINLISVKSSKNIPKHRADLFNLVNQQLNSMSEIITFGLKNDSLNELLNKNNELIKTENKKSFVSGLSSALILIITGLTIAISYKISVNLLINFEITPSTVAIFTLITLGVFEILSMIPNSLQSWNQGNAAASRITELKNKETKSLNLLEKCELKIEKKDFVAVVGSSGSGKSTFLHALLGLINEEVSLVIGDKRLDSKVDINSDSEVYAVLSDSYLYDSTVRENLLLSNQNASEVDIWNALEKVGLKALIKAMPHGLDSNVGPNGAFFSGGERQRLLLSRIYLTSASIILIDEPTEHLDESVAQTIFEEIYLLAREKTIIFTTHKEYEFKKASKVIKVENRKLVLN